MEQRALEYNSQREDLVISEYGRHVQKLIQHAQTLEKDEERQEMVEGIVKLMGQMNPQTKNAQEYEERLWNHVFRIAGHDLAVTPPEGVDVSKKEENQKGKVSYPQNDFRYRHYGKNIQILIEKAINMSEEPEKQQEFVQVIAAYMKQAYKSYNREYFVNDEVIKNDLLRLSDNKLSLEEDYNINNLSSNNRRRSNANQRRGRKSRPHSNNNNQKRRR